MNILKRGQAPSLDYPRSPLQRTRCVRVFAD